MRARSKEEPTDGALVRWANGIVFNFSIDMLVLINFIAVGFELDHGKDSAAMFDLLRLVLAILYLAELIFKLVAFGGDFFSYRPADSKSLKKKWLKGNIFDIFLVACMLIAAFIEAEPGRAWRLTILRGHRFLRLAELAETWSPLTDLWLVVSGLSRALKALGWFGLILVLVLYSAGACFAGLVTEDDIFLDSEEYFGGTFKSAITLLQLATLDNWASAVVRPLFQSNALAGILLLAFVVATAYGLLSVAVGVLVWSTVELARNHSDHASHKHMKEDHELIASLKDFFEATLIMDEKSALEFQDLQDAMAVPQVAGAIRQLELPVEDLRQLFNHLDKDRKGRIDLLQLEKGLVQLKKPATRFDVACLTANIGGSVTFVNRLEARSDELEEELGFLHLLIAKARDALRKLATSADGMGNDPDVILRKAGKIKMPPPQKKGRFSEGLPDKGRI